MTSFNADEGLSRVEFDALPRMAPSLPWSGMTPEEIMADVNSALVAAYTAAAGAPDDIWMPPSVYYGLLMYPLYRLLQRGRKRRRPRFATRVLSRKWRGTTSADRTWLSACAKRNHNALQT